MAILAKFTKQPSDVLDYDIDFSEWLPEDDDGLTAQVTVESGLTLDSFTIHGAIVKVWLSGGTSGRAYKVTVLLITVDGRSKEAEIVIKVKEQ